MMSQHDRDVLIACLTVLLAVLTFWLSMTMPMRGDFIESPGIFPGLMSVILFMFGLVYVIRSVGRGGRLRLAPHNFSVVPFLRSEHARPLVLGILFPAIYVFLGISLIGFYISSALFMAIMFYAYVRGWRRWFFLPVSIGVTVSLYLIFNKIFLLQIW
jgi:tripartite tricarboxylate transporter TctB family protein